MTSKLSLAAVGAASLLLAACGGAESGSITISLQRTDCQDGDALKDARTIEVTVRGPGMSDLTAEGEIAKGSLDLGEVPAGQDREVIVRATNGGSALVAIGRSAPFDVKADQSQSVPVPMVGLNRVHPPQDASGTCTAQQAARAGHAAAAFADGRVLLVGGFVYHFSEHPDEDWIEYLDTVELYDPASGAFRALEPLPAKCGASGTESCARAFATAVVQPLPNNRGERLLLIGGEYRDAEGRLRARGETLVFQPDTETWNPDPIQMAPRRHHTATRIENGDVYVVGGFGEPNPETGAVPVVAAVEILKPNLNSPSPGKFSVARAFHAAAPSGIGLLVAGGVDPNNQAPLELIQITPDAPNPQSPAALSVGLLGPGLAVYGKRAVVIGGQEIDRSFDAASTDVLNDMPGRVGPTGLGRKGELLSLDGTPVADTFPLGVERAFPCLAPIDGGRLLVANGIQPSGDVVTGPGSVEVLVWRDQSECKPKTCGGNSECTASSGSTCIGGFCQVSCTSDASCGSKGSCVEGVCRSDLANPAHRCVGGSTQGCFADATCEAKGDFEGSFIGGATGSATSSVLANARAWGACTRVSADQILITGGINQYPTRDTLGVEAGDAELYEISHAGR